MKLWNMMLYRVCCVFDGFLGLNLDTLRIQENRTTDSSKKAWKSAVAKEKFEFRKGAGCTQVCIMDGKTGSGELENGV
jgi:hypothetical protein